MSTMTKNQIQKMELGVKIISIVLPVVVAVLFGMRLRLDILPFDNHILPFINAVLNGICVILLGGAVMAVKQKNIKLHSNLIYASMGVSLLFLLTYVLFHITTPPTSYGGEGGIKSLYYFLLISHILLAGIQAPLVLFSFLYGYTNQIEKHKRLVKFAFPIWMYIGITGVVCYLMIEPYYPH